MKPNILRSVGLFEPFIHIFSVAWDSIRSSIPFKPTRHSLFKPFFNWGLMGESSFYDLAEAFEKSLDFMRRGAPWSDSGQYVVSGGMGW